jgi:hypothetical protein
VKSPRTRTSSIMQTRTLTLTYTAIVGADQPASDEGEGKEDRRHLHQPC